jgi:long-subunit acyl-CoA synthetase (AMP-forming)
MLFLLTLLSSSKQAFGNVIFRKGVKELHKSYQHTSAVPSVNKTVRPVKFNQPVFKYAALYGGKNALRDKHGEYTYAGLLASSQKFAEIVNKAIEGKQEERVAFLCPNDASYIVTQWACWMGGHTGTSTYCIFTYYLSINRKVAR